MCRRSCERSSLISRNFLEYECTGRFIILPGGRLPSHLHRGCPPPADLRRDIPATKRPRGSRVVSHRVVGEEDAAGRSCARVCARARTRARRHTGTPGKAQIYEPINYRARRAYLTRPTSRSRNANEALTPSGSRLDVNEEESRAGAKTGSAFRRRGGNVVNTRTKRQIRPLTIATNCPNYNLANCLAAQQGFLLIVPSGTEGRGDGIV